MAEKMKIKVRILFLYMFICLSFTSCRAYAAKVPKLNKTKLTINAGKNFRFKVKNYPGKVKWSSSNSYVAKITKKGVLKAKHMGYTVIAAQADGILLKCRVTVRGVKKEKPYIFCYEVDRKGARIETGNVYNLGVMNGSKKTWEWSIDDTRYGAFYTNGNVVPSTTRSGRYCQLVETYMGRPGVTYITARSGSVTLRYRLVVNASAEDAVFMNMRSQVLSQIITPGMSAQEICLAVAKWLSSYASYLITNGPDYSLLTTHTGQCYHYARTYDFMLDGTTIPCDYVSTADHAWNQVQIDGQWYNIDVTSFDTDRERYPYDYSHFLVSDNIFWKKESRNIPCHQCVSTRYDFGKHYNDSPWAQGTWTAY